jgi:hypothetical protein
MLVDCFSGAHSVAHPAFTSHVSGCTSLPELGQQLHNLLHPAETPAAPALLIIDSLSSLLLAHPQLAVSRFAASLRGSWCDECASA